MLKKEMRDDETFSSMFSQEKINEIYLLEEKYEIGPLRHFFHFIRLLGIDKKGFSFSFAPRDPEFYNDVKLAEQMFLEVFSGEFYLDKDQISLMLNNYFSPSFKKFWNEISAWEKFPYQVSKKILKKMALIAAIIKPAPFLFLDYPEKSLTEEDLKLLQQIVIYECLGKDRMVVIRSPNEKLWDKIVTKKVETFGSDKQLLFSANEKEKDSNKESFSLKFNNFSLT